MYYLEIARLKAPARAAAAAAAALMNFKENEVYTNRASLMGLNDYNNNTCECFAMLLHCSVKSRMFYYGEKKGKKISPLFRPHWFPRLTFDPQKTFPRFVNKASCFKNNRFRKLSLHSDFMAWAGHMTPILSRVCSKVEFTKSPQRCGPCCGPMKTLAFRICGRFLCVLYRGGVCAAAAVASLERNPGLVFLFRYALSLLPSLYHST